MDFSALELTGAAVLNSAVVMAISMSLVYCFVVHKIKWPAVKMFVSKMVQRDTMFPEVLMLV